MSLIFFYINCIYCRKNYSLYYLFFCGGGRHLVSCFIFREYLSMLTSKCLVDLVASQDEKFLSIICVLLSPAVGVLHIMFKIFIVMLMLDLAGNNLIFHENLKTKTGSPCQSFARCYHVRWLSPQTLLKCYCDQIFTSWFFRCIT